MSFLQLPAELRELVYSFTFGDKIEPWPFARCRKLGWQTKATSAAISTNLLLANHQIHDEVTKVMHEQALFLVEHLAIYDKLARTASLRARIRRLSIGLSHDNFFRLFGSDLGDGSFDDVWFGNSMHGNHFSSSPRSTVRLLRRMHNLKLLVLVIAPPPRSGEYPYTVCQKRIVDKIFEAALPWISGHPITVMGWVKQSQKEIFEAKCARSRQQYLDWFKDLADKEDAISPLKNYHEWLEDDGGVSLEGLEIDQGNAVEGGAAAEDDGEESVEFEEYPPRCDCKHSCDYNLWSPWLDDDIGAEDEA
jgi:hypothetical protein